MKNDLKFLTIGLILILLLAACGGTTEPAAESTSNDSNTAAESSDDSADSEVMEDESMDEEMMEDESMDEEMMEDESMDEEMAEDEHMDEEMAEDEHMDEEMMEDESMDEEMMEDESMDEEMMEDESMDEETAVASAGPDWLTLPISDARTGDTFSFADFAGKTVYVEPMATWCTNCRRQLNTLSEGMAQLPSDVIIVGLSVEPNLPNDVLAGYANNQGYNFLFAVATPELVEAMVGEYGRNVANPPATPHFIIRPDGSLTELSTGFHSIEEIVAQIETETQ